MAIEIEVGIQHVTAYERKSLKEELVNATPQGMVTPTLPCQPSESSHLTENDEDGGSIEDNTLYQLHSNTTPNTLMTDAGVGSPPPPVGKASLGCKNNGKMATMRFRENTLSGSEDERMPFKKVMGGKWERSVEGSDPVADSVKPTQLDVSAWVCADFG